MGQTNSQSSEMEEQDQEESLFVQKLRHSTKKSALPTFSDSLVPSDEYERKGKQVVNQVFEILRTNRSDVDRVVITGSMGKRTAVDYEESNRPDLDVVIFLNGPLDWALTPVTRPPFEKTLLEFRDILSRHSDIKINFTSKIVMKIELCGYDMDICCGMNLCKANWKKLFRTTGQKDRTMEIIEKLETPGRYKHSRHYSSGLAEASLAFVRSQSPHTHSVIRLAKFWNSQIKLDKSTHYVPGRSYLMECIAIHAVTIVGGTSIVLAIKQFLTEMANFRNIRIVGYSSQFSDQVISSSVHHDHSSLPFVLDPINVYNNLAWIQEDQQKKEEIMSTFERHARASLRKLETFENGTADEAQLYLNDPSQIFVYDWVDNLEANMKSTMNVLEVVTQRMEGDGAGTSQRRANEFGQVNRPVNLSNNEKDFVDLVETGINIWSSLRNA